MKFEFLDVYSFAIVMWECVSRRTPFEEFTTVWSIRDAVISGGRPAIPENTSFEYKTLMERCWHDTPSNRPSFSDICDNLDRIYQNSETRC